MTLSEADFKVIAAKLEAMLEGKCPHCGKDVDRERQVGHCVYGEPCGHRLYQGKVGLAAGYQKTKVSGVPSSTQEAR